MKNTLRFACVMVWTLGLTSLPAYVQADASECRTCDDVTPGSQSEVRIEYRDGTSRSACGLRCAGAMLAAYREKYVKTIWVREYESGKLLDAKKAFWVIGAGDGGREAFSEAPDAESFSAAHGGRVAAYKDIMAALFSGMFDGIKVQPVDKGAADDIAAHPACFYCGMDAENTHIAG